MLARKTHETIAEPFNLRSAPYSGNDHERRSVGQDERDFDPSQIRVAIVHDWLPLYGGAERVLEQIIGVFPQADVFSMVDFIPAKDRAFLQDKPVQTSFVQNLPFSEKIYRAYLPVMLLAVEQFDLSSYDLIISSSYAVAKGVLTGPDQLHICYCHSPIRYAWDMQHQYLNDRGTRGGLGSWGQRALLHYIRMWDVRTANGVNHFIANSAFIARRIEKVYQRTSTVIYPPVNTAAFQLNAGDREDYYVTASRLVPYKRVDLIVQAFSEMPDKKLVVIGDGPEFQRLSAMATANIKMVGHQSSEALQKHMREARAFVYAAEEDFGIITVEAQACGTPVVAFGRGGSRETVVPGKTGILFCEQSEDSLIAAIERFEASAHAFDPVRIREHAEQFSIARFRRDFATFVGREWDEFQAKMSDLPLHGDRSIDCGPNALPFAASA